MSNDALNVELPPKLAGALFKPSRYKFIRGGRGSAKSWSVARALIVKAFSKPERILCTREVQKSIKQSVHQLLKDQIASLKLTAFFEVLENEIRGANGSAFYFTGLSDHTVDSIKSFEGCTLVWCEEAHSITQQSWRILTPTIRAKNSEIWATYNPELETDETHQMAVINPQSDTISIELNYQDNPWFPEVLEKERLHALATMKPEDYAHIWEGRCKPAVEGAIYFDAMSATIAAGRIRDVPHDGALKTHVIFDLGMADSMTLILAQKVVSEIRVIHYIEGNQRILADYSQELRGLRLDDQPMNWGSIWLPHDGFHKRHQTGKDDATVLEGLGWAVERVPNTEVNTGIDRLREIFPRIYFNKDRTARLVECLKRYRWNINSKTGQATQPLHDEFSHGCLDGDSLISTARGLVAIRDVLIGDMVETPAGYAHVSFSGVTKIATEIIEMTLEDGSVLLMTPEHRVFTMRGVVTANTLRYNDSIFTKESAPCLSFQSIKSVGYRDALIESFRARDTGFGLPGVFTQVRSVAGSAYCILRFIAQYTVSRISGLRLNALTGICAIPTLTTGLLSGQPGRVSTLFKRLTGYASTSSQMGTIRQITENIEVSPCTAMFGKNIMAASQTECTSTTLTATNRTIASRILSCLQQVTTASTILARMLGLAVMQTNGKLSLLVNWLKHGTLAQRVWLGILNTGRRHGETGQKQQSNVVSAEKITRHTAQQYRSSAIKIAKLRRLGGADATRPVYDLTVDHHHCYIANGVLVSNCDAARYLALVADQLTNDSNIAKPIKYKQGRYIA